MQTTRDIIEQREATFKPLVKSPELKQPPRPGQSRSDCFISTATAIRGGSFWKSAVVVWWFRHGGPLRPRGCMCAVWCARSVQTAVGRQCGPSTVKVRCASVPRPTPCVSACPELSGVRARATRQVKGAASVSVCPSNQLHHCFCASVTTCVSRQVSSLLG